MSGVQLIKDCSDSEGDIHCCVYSRRDSKNKRNGYSVVIMPIIEIGNLGVVSCKGYKSIIRKSNHFNDFVIIGEINYVNKDMIKDFSEKMVEAHCMKMEGGIGENGGSGGQTDRWTDRWSE